MLQQGRATMPCFGAYNRCTSSSTSRNAHRPVQSATFTRQSLTSDSKHKAQYETASVHDSLFALRPCFSIALSCRALQSLTSMM
eukprot:1034653-Amphidinium_carterae.1